MRGILGFVLVAQLLSVLLFAIGFFPQKNVMNGNATFSINKKLQEETKQPFKKLVLIVIDALRSDFLFDESSSNFHFVHSKLNSGEAWGYTAYSNPPTVTLPRLKGITTGSTPNFLDALLNVAEDDSSSNVKDQDSWLKQFHSKGYRMRFFGDDTWLKLFPLEFFNDYEGTNSFFVSDFEQVDLNVTRHIPRQLEKTEDWDVLILHYLGLDHIGHKGGANSKFMPAKHREMDQIVGKLYDNLDEDTLLIVMGDHGMNDAGNHGGSSAGETSAGLVFFSKKLSKFKIPIRQLNARLPITSNSSDYQYLTQVQQMDLVPTLAALYNVPIPKNSVGVIIPDFLQLLDPNIIDTKLLENYKQLLELSKVEYDDELFNLNVFDLEKRSECQRIMKTLQEKLIAATTEYDYTMLAIGCFMSLVLTLVMAIFSFFQMASNKYFFASVLLASILGFSCFGSSFVEEEHQIWWWVITGCLFISAAKTMHYFEHSVILLCLRLIRGWNNTGQKTVYPYVISKILEENSTLQWNLNALTFFVISLNGNQNSMWGFISSSTLGILCLAYKATWAVVNKEIVPWYIQNIMDNCASFFQDGNKKDYSSTLIPMASFFLHSVAAIIFFTLLWGKFNKHHPSFSLKCISKYVTILMMFLSSSVNIPQFLIFEIMRSFISKILKKHYNSNIYLTSLISLCLQNFAFFQFGGTNSIATIDISNAYHGISENYNIYVIGVLMVLSNFAPSIYWAMFSWDIIYDIKETNFNKWASFTKSKIPTSLFNCIVGLCLMLACVMFRYHLFVWSVFSPKLCYFVGWNLFMNAIFGWVLEVLLLSITN
ncbi:hypothetical protein KAFR_0A01730 [Kazachstania africana CBS 2517]|uniref:GPI ethanolamine phosphate transferase 2 n=1 Tax=Kazachstania africana (strain ATCC 22294 / BCRC 22015 / CBS 2517 / CECT 1963 / NBRC 1671 / NRRL Y-8276) TaxID=1071382 RepID=H2AML1_KAZAF|nr:hypothetical protein KAFR_0A01730 [Kazachstania africana CBS 2517]CCF55611.1 hypothetical protein KAFR_0A01730 [Kazachstania africana CBS 2517]